MFKIYKGQDVVVEGESPLTITGLDPDTNVTTGTYQVVRVDGDKESDRVDVPAFKTLPIAVTGVTVAPKTKTADSGTAGSEQLTATVAPGNATNKAVTYSIAPQTEGLSVDANGKIDWTAAVPSGTYTTTVKTTDGDKTDTHVLTLKDPVIAVTSVTLSPKTSTGETGTAGERQLAATVEPNNATNKAITYNIEPSATGLAVSESGKITWSAETPAGTYTTTVKSTDGDKTDTHVLTLTDPEPEPEPEPDPEEPEE